MTLTCATSSLPAAAPPALLVVAVVAAPVVTVAVLMSAVAAYFYVRVIVLMFFSEPVGDGPSVTTPSIMTSFVIGFGVLATLVLGIVPGALIDVLGRVGVFIR